MSCHTKAGAAPFAFALGVLAGYGLRERDWHQLKADAEAAGYPTSRRRLTPDEARALYRDLTATEATIMVDGKPVPLTTDDNLDDDAANAVTQNTAAIIRYALAVKPKQAVETARAHLRLAPYTRMFPSLCHIGTLDSSDRNGWSLEGDGLSVSAVPDAWQRIAKLGGRSHWTVERQDGQPLKFLDAHRIDSRLREDITRWGLREGLVERTQTFTVTYWDDEFEQDMTLTFDDEREAAEDADSYDTDYTVVDDIRFLDNTTTPRGADGNARDILLTVWAAKTTDFDGIYWDDDLDPSRLSAPRGVILPTQIPAIRHRPVTDEDRDAWDAFIPDEEF